jgi:hypothetical protein
MLAIVSGNREHQGKKWGAEPEPNMNWWKI